MRLTEHVGQKIESKRLSGRKHKWSHKSPGKAVCDNCGAERELVYGQQYIYNGSTTYAPCE